MSHFAKPLRFIDQFLIHFQPLFSQTQMNILRQMIYAMFFDYKRLNLSAIAKRTHLDYQKLQYFFSESDWSVDQLNDVRLKLLQNQHTTRTTLKGVMAIDDTSVPKPHAEKTEGAQFLPKGAYSAKSFTIPLIPSPNARNPSPPLSSSTPPCSCQRTPTTLNYRKLNPNDSRNGLKINKVLSGGKG